MLSSGTDKLISLGIEINSIPVKFWIIIAGTFDASDSKQVLEKEEIVTLLLYMISENIDCVKVILLISPQINLIMI